MTDEYRKYLKYKRKYLEKKRIEQEGGLLSYFRGGPKADENQSQRSSSFSSRTPGEIYKEYKCDVLQKDKTAYENQQETYSTSVSNLSEIVKELDLLIKNLNTEKTTKQEELAAINKQLTDIQTFKRIKDGDITKLQADIDKIPSLIDRIDKQLKEDCGEPEPANS